MFILKTEDLGKHIKTVRKQQGLTQRDLASTCNVGVRFIVDLEKGKKTLQIGNAIKVVNMLGLKINVAE